MTDLTALPEKFVGRGDSTAGPELGWRDDGVIGIGLFNVHKGFGDEPRNDHWPKERYSQYG